MTTAFKFVASLIIIILALIPSTNILRLSFLCYIIIFTSIKHLIESVSCCKVKSFEGVNQLPISILYGTQELV